MIIWWLGDWNTLFFIHYGTHIHINRTWLCLFWPAKKMCTETVVRVASWSTLFHQFYIVSSGFTSTNSHQHYNSNAKTKVWHSPSRSYCASFVLALILRLVDLVIRFASASNDHSRHFVFASLFGTLALRVKHFQAMYILNEIIRHQFESSKTRYVNEWKNEQKKIGIQKMR